ncbi:dTDP-glucose 4,6-dehydratase [Nonomuraea sp. NPDC048916]|uniref:dTDP-glucose 4,6-dehydratase n=1 Tax=Nonomuraea sp. NPDC048916 TaxID=3154232 RepID=UPI0033E25F09
MKVLVTGGAGFIGSHYVRALVRKGGVSVTVLDKLTYAGNLANLSEVWGSIRFIRGDVCDAELAARLSADHDQIVHFAAESHVDRSIVDATSFVMTNVVGTQTLLDAALAGRVGTFVHISTDEVYGSIDSGSWSETEPVSPNSPYAASKAASDLLALAYHTTHGLDVRITRCSNTFGPHQYPEKIIPLFVIKLLMGEPVPLYGDGGNVRDWLHVDDHVRAIELVREAGRAGQIYNVGAGCEQTNRELVTRLLEACGATWGMVKPVADRPGHDRRYSLDCTKIRRELGFAPREDFATRLRETVEWYRANPWWWRRFHPESATVAPSRDVGIGTPVAQDHHP